MSATARQLPVSAASAAEGHRGPGMRLGAGAVDRQLDQTRMALSRGQQRPPPVQWIRLREQRARPRQICLIQRWLLLNRQGRTPPNVGEVERAHLATLGQEDHRMHPRGGTVRTLLVNGLRK